MKKKKYDYEILSPVGDFERLETALYFGADAVYLGGEEFGLRAYGVGFNNEDLEKAVNLAHSMNRKVFTTVNIYANNNDFKKLGEYLRFLEKIKVDAIIVSDPGIVLFAKKTAPDLEIHLSTQANTTNKYAAKFWAENGVKRIVLAREMKLDEIKELRDFLPNDVEIETFVHGAMCMAYSGRCLLSNYLTNRDGNRGECVQACRWEYEINEINRENKKLRLTEDKRGTYILNSKDLNMIEHIDKLLKAGVYSFKIEGRMKTPYYVACTTNAYSQVAKAIANSEKYKNKVTIFKNELEKINHRGYSTGFYFDKNGEISLDSSQSVSDYKFMAIVRDYDKSTKTACIEQRNRFSEGDELEILSPMYAKLNKMVKICDLKDEKGNAIPDAKFVQQKLFFKSSIELSRGDILRKKVAKP